MRGFIAALVTSLTLAGACSESAGPGIEAPGTETVRGDPALPLVEAPAFPLRNFIAYTSNRYDPRGDVFLISTDGSSRKRVSDAISGEACPVVSPDGAGLAFLSGGNLTILSTSGRVNISGSFACPIWSPDGTRVVIGSPSFLTVYSLAGATVAQLGISGEVADAAWAPDGKSIAFTTCLRNRSPCFDYRVNIVPTANFTASGVRFLASGSGPTFSPDGSTLAFRCGNLETLLVVEQTICSIPAAGGIPVALATGGRAQWSPVDQNIAYACGEFVCIINAATRANRQLASRATQHRWSPDGQALALAWGRLNNDLHLIKADGTNLRNLTLDRSRDELGGWSPVTPGASTAALAPRTPKWIGEKVVAGQDILYQCCTRDAPGPLKMIDNRGERARTLLPSSLPEKCPSISHDRKSVAFESSGIWVAAADGGGEVQVSDTLNLVLTSCPVWSPDSRHLAFVTGTGGDMKLWIAQIGSGLPAHIASASDIRQVTWTPDNQAVIYLSAPAGAGPVTLQRSTITGSTAAFGQAGWIYPSFASDGRLVIQCGSQICVAGSQGENPKIVTDGIAPLVSPDGKKIMFLRGGTSVVTINSDGTDQRNVIDLGFRPSWISWSPTSDAISFEGNNNVNVVRMDGTFTKQITAEVWAIRPSWTSRRADFF